MPKKFKGENSKAVEARQRKEAVRQAEKDQKQKELEDEYWRDDDKHAARKQSRKDEREKKKQGQLERKQEAQKLLEEEMSSIKSSKPAPSAKVTRAEIEANRKKMAAEAAAEKKKTEIPYDERTIEENVNRQEIEGEEARTVEDAISVLSVQDGKADRHPEKRVKAAFAEYEEINLPILKAENPTLRLSQLKQILKKNWMKSPENPLNQRHGSYNDRK